MSRSITRNLIVPQSERIISTFRDQDIWDICEILYRKTTTLISYDSSQNRNRKSSSVPKNHPLVFTHSSTHIETIHRGFHTKQQYTLKIYWVLLLHTYTHTNTHTHTHKHTHMHTQTHKHTHAHTRTHTHTHMHTHTHTHNTEHWQ